MNALTVKTCRLACGIALGLSIGLNVVNEVNRFNDSEVTVLEFEGDKAVDYTQAAILVELDNLLIARLRKGGSSLQCWTVMINRSTQIVSCG